MRVSALRRLRTCECGFADGRQGPDGPTVCPDCGQMIASAVRATPETTMDDEAFDLLTGQVFATPAGERWLVAVESFGGENEVAVVAEIRQRLARARKAWATGALASG